MTTLVRWGRFNLVGGVGMVVQLWSLAVFHRWMGGHYLLASAAALEVTLLHNFCWHVRYTWRDRADGCGGMKKLVRFHLANGVVSLVGNLGVVRVLCGAGIPLVAANAVAIVGCSLVNFWVGNVWAFGERWSGVSLAVSLELSADS